MCEDPEPNETPRRQRPDVIFVTDGDPHEIAEHVRSILRPHMSVGIIGMSTSRHMGLALAVLSASHTTREVTIRVEHNSYDPLLNDILRDDLRLSDVFALKSLEFPKLESQDFSAAAKAQLMEIAKMDCAPLTPEPKPYKHNDRGIYALQPKDMRMRAHKENRDSRRDLRFH